MEIAAKINFETTNSQDYVDKMIVCIDNNEIEIPIQAFPAKPILKIDGLGIRIKCFVFLKFLINFLF